MASITHRIDDKLKRALDRFCQTHGLKQQAVVEDALATWLENAADLGIIEERRRGPWVEWKKVRDDV